MRRTNYIRYAEKSFTKKYNKSTLDHHEHPKSPNPSRRGQTSFISAIDPEEDKPLGQSQPLPNTPFPSLKKNWDTSANYPLSRLSSINKATLDSPFCFSKTTISHFEHINC
jgi:hypothetical protein